MLYRLIGLQSARDWPAPALVAATPAAGGRGRHQWRQTWMSVRRFLSPRSKYANNNDTTTRVEASDLPNAHESRRGGSDHGHDFFNRRINWRYVPASGDRASGCCRRKLSRIDSVIRRAASKDGITRYVIFFVWEKSEWAVQGPSAVASVTHSTHIFSILLDGDVHRLWTWKWLFSDVRWLRDNFKPILTFQQCNRGLCWNMKLKRYLSEWGRCQKAIGLVVPISQEVKSCWVSIQTGSYVYNSKPRRPALKMYIQVHILAERFIFAGDIWSGVF